MDYSDFEDLLVEVVDGVGHFRINRPEKLNALRTKTFREIIELGRRFGADDDVRSVLCTHEGRGFSAGADLTDRDPSNPAAPTRAESAHSMGVSEIGAVMASLDKPTIAAIDGVAAGGGMGFATSFDIRVLGPNARFITVFARRALAPDCGLSYFLPKLVGHAKALELMFTARDVLAEEAVQIGLGNMLVDDAEATAWEMARELAAGPPLAYMWAKRDVFNSWTGPSVQQQVEFEWSGQAQLRGSKDVVEGRMSFVENRAPNFTGE